VSDDARNHLGPVVASVSKASDKQRLGPWLDLMALTAHDPDRHWSAVLLNRPRLDNS
jgi:hypothetical protein